MFAQHRQAFLDLMEDGDLALFPGAELVTRNHDVDFPFRQQSDYWYLTGLSEPSSMLLMAKGIGDLAQETLFLQPRDELAEIWHGKRLGAEGAMESLGFQAAAPIEDFETHFAEWLPKAKRLWVSLGMNPAFDQKVLAALTALRGKLRIGLEPPQILVDPRPELAQLRLFKSPAELDLLRKVAAVSSEAHCLAMAQCRPGMNEYELEALIHYTFRRHGCNDSGWAYPSIVAGGSNACILHYTNNDQPLADGDVVLIDAGGEYQSLRSRYHADLPRKRQVQCRATRYLRGCSRSAEGFDRTFTARLHAHRGARGERQDACRRSAAAQGAARFGGRGHREPSYRSWYMHNTGHWLGLDVHDAGRYREGGSSISLQPGMVMTIEPGLYFQADDETIPAELRGIGVRIEDDVHITGGDPEILTIATPKEVADVEEACAAERAVPPTLDTEMVTR